VIVDEEHPRQLSARVVQILVPSLARCSVQPSNHGGPPRHPPDRVNYGPRLRFFTRA